MEKIHPETGEILHRDIRPIEYSYKGEKIILDMPGWYPENSDDGILSPGDWEVADKALMLLKARYEEKLQNNFSAEIF